MSYRFYRVRQVAEMLSVSVPTIYRRARKGDLPPVKKLFPTDPHSPSVFDADAVDAILRTAMRDGAAA